MGLRCVIVDDSPHFVDAARALLERGGVRVIGVASTTEEAVRRVQELRPDVVLVDIELGGESGFDLARRLEHETTLDRSQVIMISTYAEEDLEDMVTAAPVAAFLSKSHLSVRTIREIVGDAAH